MELVRAAPSPSLSVRVRQRRALRFDTPVGEVRHVRAASGVCLFEGRLHMVQDDALAIARVRLEPFALDTLDLPLRADGARYFDKARGNKRDKPDLEDVVARGDRLWAFGSGSSPRRTSVLSARSTADGLTARWHEAPALYEALAVFPGFLTSELNLEGLFDTGPALRVFQRSNGSPLPGATPTCASLDVPWDTLVAHLDGLRSAPPEPYGLVHYTLPSLEGVRLTITAAARGHDGAPYLLASAEASPNAYDDGAVLGSIVARVQGAELSWGVLCDAAGAPLREKAEGLVASPGAPGVFHVVFDPDDHERPADLCEVLVTEQPAA
jgi:hypothetical protein